MRATHADLQEATEKGACGLAILFACREFRFDVVARARKGTGVDYWLAGEGPFVDLQARLEVSGILNNPAAVHERAKQKKRQTGASDHTHVPVVVAVIEFGTPGAWLEYFP